MPRRHQMIHGMIVHQQVVGDDTAMASPPDRFRTHQRQASVAAKLDQLIKGGGEFITQRVVGVVVKTPHPPHGVGGFVDTRLLRSPPTQGRAVAIADLYIREIVRQAVDVEHGIGARSWK